MCVRERGIRGAELSKSRPFGMQSIFFCYFALCGHLFTHDQASIETIKTVSLYLVCSSTIVTHEIMNKSMLVFACVWMCVATDISQVSNGNLLFMCIIIPRAAWHLMNFPRSFVASMFMTHHFISFYRGKWFEEIKPLSFAMAVNYFRHCPQQAE